DLRARRPHPRRRRAPPRRRRSRLRRRRRRAARLGRAHRTQRARNQRGAVVSLSTLGLDAYQLTTLVAHADADRLAQRVVMSFFFRKLPAARNYVVFCGLRSIVEHARQMRFEPDELRTLTGHALSSDGKPISIFGAPLKIYTPMLQVRTDMMRAKLIETPWLCRINHMSMVASKAARVVGAAAGKPVLEFGTRRTHPAAAIDAAYA